MKKTVSAIAFAALTPAMASAAVVDWTDWQSYDATAASGSIGSVGVSYTGDVNTSRTTTGTGTNYWTEPQAGNEPYTGNSVVDNAPDAAEMVALSAGNVTNTITFTEAVTDPIMAIVSLGRLRTPVTYDFDQSFTVLSEGRGYWGDGFYTLGTGDALTGYEFHGAIQFSGTFSSLSWSVDNAEFWHGITVGLAEKVNVSEPSTFAIFGLGLIGLGIMRRRIS